MDWKKVKKHVASTTVEERNAKRQAASERDVEILKENYGKVASGISNDAESRDYISSAKTAANAGAISALERRRQRAEEYLEKNSDKYKNGKELLSETKNLFTSIEDLANANLAVENYWGQFGSEEGYNDHLNQIKEQERLEYLDIKEARDKKYALEQELNSLRGRTGGTTSIVSSALSSKGGIYDSSSRIETDRVRALQDEINALDRDINLASRKQTNKYLTDRAVNAEDFGEYSFNPIIPEKEYNIYKQANRERDNSAERFMTEDEKAIYNYYFNKVGEEKAEEYLDSIQEDLNFRQAKAIFEGNEDNVLAQLALMAPTQGLEQSKSGFQGALRMVMGDDSYQPVGTYDYLGQMAKEDLADKGFKLPEWMGGQSIGQLAYDLVNTGANMAPSIAVGALTGTGPLAFGASAAGNAYTQKINEGYSKDQATAYGVIIGVSEATLEKVVGAIGFGGKTLASKAVAKLLPKIDNAAARIAVKYGSSMLSEGIEEGLQEVLEPLYRNAAFGENNELEISEDAIYSALLGALSGGLMEGTPYAISEGINASYQNKINEKYGKSVGEIVTEGLSAPQDSEAYKLAKEAKAKLNAGEELSEEELDVLAKVSAEVPQERKQAVTEASEAKPIVLQSKEIPNPGRRTVGISEKQMETFASKLPNATKDTGKQVTAMYDIKDGVSKETFIRGVDEAYRYGSMNFSLEEMDRGGSFAKDIPSEKKLQAYYMGQRNAETATITKANEQQKKALSGVKGKVVFEGNAATQIKNDKQRSTIRFINSVLKNASSMEYHIFASYEEDGKRVYKNNEGKIVPAPNGFYDPKNHQIWIDVNAGAKGQGIMLYTLTHEHVHDIKVWSAEHYNELVKITSQAFEHAGKSFKEAVDVKYAQYKKSHPDTTYEDAQEEVVAEAMSGLLSDEKALREFSEQIQKQDKSLWNRIKAWFNDVIARITAAYKGVEPESEEAKLLMEQRELFEKAQKVFAEAVVTAGENYKNSSAQTIESIGLKTLAKAETTEGKILFQYRAMETDENTYRKMLTDLKILSTEQINNLFSTIDKAIDIIKDNLEILDYAWEADINDRAFSPVKPNSDSLYQVSVDFSTLCRKRLLQQAVQAQLQQTLDRPITREEGIAIRDALMALQEEGRKIEIACALCYVESARMKSPEQIKKFLANRESVLKEFFASKSGGDIKGKIRQAELEARERLGVGDASLKSLSNKVAAEIRAAKKEAKASYKPTEEEQSLIDLAMRMTVTDFTSPKGLENLAKNYPVLFDAYTSYIRNATKSKGIENDTWWRAGDSKKISDTLIENMNKENGLRSQSWSDFQVIHMLDYIAAVIELSTRNSKMQAYTKVPDYVELMGNTGIMINLSLIPTRNYLGFLDYDSTEGMDYKKSLELRNKYHKTAGTICIGVNNNQIKQLFEDITIDYVIPYHKSGMAAHVRKAMHLPAWDQYEQYQSEKNLSREEAIKNAEKYGVKLLAETDANYHKHTSFSEWFNLEEAQQIAKMENANPSDPAKQKKYGVMYGGYMAMQNAASNYLKLCAERGLAPVFSHKKADFTGEDNYWKVLIDRKMVDNVTGEIIEQEAIKPVFEETEVLRILNDELERYPGVKADQDYAIRRVTEKFLSGGIKGGMSSKAIADVVKKPVDNITNTNIIEAGKEMNTGTKFQDRDSEYMEAVKKADISTMQKLVEEAAKEAGYTEKLYHGTNQYGFTKADVSKSDDKISFFATDSEEVAQTYSGVGGTRWITDNSLSEKSIDKAYDEAEKNVNDCVDDLFWAVEHQLPYTIDFSDLSNYAEELADGLYMNKISDSEVDENLYDYIAERVHHSWTYARDNYGEYEDYDGYLDWVESEEAEKIWDATDKLTQAILNYVKARNMTGLEDVGNYGLYAHVENFLEINANGKAWNQIPFDEYDTTGFHPIVNTRQLARYAWDEGYGGVKISNVFDDGGRGKHQTKPATVYIFFDPQEQVKSADPVTKDDNGNVIPLSERFKKENDDIRYQDRLSAADKNRVTILENKIERLEKELKEIESKAVLAGQMSQGKAMAKDLRRKTEVYENAIAKKKEQISAVRQQKNELLAKAKAERAEAVERVRKADRERMEKAIADIKAMERAKFNAAKERSDEQKRAIIEKYQTSIKKATEGRHRTDIRGKIKRVVNELNTLLTKQTKERHIPLELQKPVADALDILNLDDPRYYNSRIKNLEEKIENAKSSEERHLLQEELNKIIDQRTAFKDKIAGLKKAYEAIKTSTDPFIAVGYNENIAKMIDRVAEDIGDTLLRDMNMTQLQEVYDLYKGILKTVRDANKFFNEEKGASVVEAGRNVVSEIEASGKTIDQISRKKLERKKFFWNNLKPVYAFKKLGSKTLENLFGGILKGQGTWAKDVSEAIEFFERTGNKYGYNKWDKKRTFEFTSNTGKKFSLNLQQMMSLYAYSKRDQAFKHLTDGGFVFDSKETIKKNGKEYVVNTAQAFNISAATLQQIIGKLSTDQRMFVDEMQKYLSETMGAKGNEVSRAMYDIELFREAEGYFPLKSAKQFLYDRNEVTNETRQLVNSGFTKPIQPGANNPIILTGFIDVWSNHVNDMSMYHAFVIPIENFNKVYNFQFGRGKESDSKSVKSAIQDSFTEAANQYIEQLLKDINGGARTDPREGSYKRIIGNWKKAAVFASASVAVQQVSAIGRAFAEINPVYFMAPTEIGVLKHKKQWEQLKKYAPVAVIKEMGYFDTNMGQSTVEFIKGEKTLKDRADDIFGFAPAKADEYIWCAIWDAVKRETKAKHKELNVNSDEFLKIAGERVTEVIDKTQVYDSVLSRSGNMRSKNIFMQMLTAFMAEPITSANMVEQAFREAKAGHPKKAMAYINSVGASVIINSLLVSFVYALRDDDEDERFHDKYLEALLKELADGFNPLTYIPFAKDVWSIFQGWDVERVDMSLFKDLYDNLEKEVKTVKELVEGIIDGSLSEEEIKAGFKEAGEYMFPVLDTIASMNGIPLKNLRRDFYTMPKNTFKIFNQNQKELSYSEKYLWDILHEAFLDQTPFGHVFFESKDEKLFNAFDSEDKVYIGRLEKTYSSEDAYSNAAKAVIKKGVIGGEFSESQAKTYLVDYIGLKSDDAEGYIHSWKFEEKWGFAWSDRAEAYANGQIKEDKLKQAVMEYKEFSAEETDKAEKEVEKIKFKAENGFDYSARRNEYIEGNITKEQLKKALMDVDGKTSEEADMQIKLYDLQKAGFEEVTEYAVKDYYEFIKPAGISEEVYFKFFEDTKDIKGDYDSKGESIPYSKTKKIMPYIDRLPLTAEQKTAVAKSFGWSDKTIREYKLW